MRLAVTGRVAQLTEAHQRLLFERRPTDEADVQAATRDMLRRVRTEGDEALRDFARRFDGADLDGIEVPRQRWGEAVETLAPEVTAALSRAARNIDRFHRAQIPADVEVEVEPGVKLGRVFVPLDAVGVYAPGGRAAYPSSVLMGVVPARAAGVREIVVCSPPGPDGLPSAVVQAAAAIGGATRLFAVGGAGAVGAMAYGTTTVPRCAAVVGPGNRWVLEAKRQVAGEVIIDSPAGPSEVLVIADEGCAPPAWLAAELVAQAEHDPDAAVAFVTTSPSLLEAVGRELEAQVAASPRADVVRTALETCGAMLLADDHDEMLVFAEAYAAEHLSLCTRDPAADRMRLRTPGTVFLGGASSVAFGDYMTGANHVLPTAGTARSFSGLGALDFVRSYTWQSLTPEAAAAMAEPVAILAEAEGLPGHAAAARMRASAEDGSTGEAAISAGEDDRGGAP
ncbi:MAG: histidinol dehydrogenase [Gemmatimonadetes bacterium]|nr:histidinol dehydrogenase [Gemmatimonadota bacterium]